MPHAARKGDPIGHSPATSWLVKGLLIGAAIGVGVVATMSGVGLLVGAAIIGGLAAGGAGVGELLSSMSWAPKEVCGMIITGSFDIIINNRPAARAHVDMTVCSKHSGTPPIATGSATVFFNKMPAARVDDKITCGAVIVEGSPDVIIEGGTVQTDTIHPENLVPAWVHWALLAVGVGAAFILATPSVALLGLAGGISGGLGFGWLGGKIFGEGSDGQKWMMLGGSLVGGMAATKGGVWFNKNYTVTTRGLGSNLGNVKIIPKNQPLIDESQAALGRASAAKEVLPNTREYSAKTVASDGEKTLSGWKQPVQEGYAQATPEQVKATSEAIGHELKPHPYDKDFPGQYNASHAEKQISILRPNEPIGVSKLMCSDCQGYFSKLAQSRGVDQVVTDPTGTRIFHADGTVTLIK